MASDESRAVARSSVWHFYFRHVASISVDILDTYRKWSAHDVELALWSFYFAKKLQPDLLKMTNSEPNDEPRGKKRTTEDDTGNDIEGEKEDSSLRSRKRRKC